MATHQQPSLAPSHNPSQIHPLPARHFPFSSTSNFLNNGPLPSQDAGSAQAPADVKLKGAATGADVLAVLPSPLLPDGLPAQHIPGAHESGDAGHLDVSAGSAQAPADVKLKGAAIGADVLAVLPSPLLPDGLPAQHIPGAHESGDAGHLDVSAGSAKAPADVKLKGADNGASSVHDSRLSLIMPGPQADQAPVPSERFSASAASASIKERIANALAYADKHRAEVALPRDICGRISLGSTLSPDMRTKRAAEISKLFPNAIIHQGLESLHLKFASKNELIAAMKVTKGKPISERLIMCLQPLACGLAPSEDPLSVDCLTSLSVVNDLLLRDLMSQALASFAIEVDAARIVPSKGSAQRVLHFHCHSLDDVSALCTLPASRLASKLHELDERIPSSFTCNFFAPHCPHFSRCDRCNGWGHASSRCPSLVRTSINLVFSEAVGNHGLALISAVVGPLGATARLGFSPQTRSSPSHLISLTFPSPAIAEVALAELLPSIMHLLLRDPSPAPPANLGPSCDQCGEPGHRSPDCKLFPPTSLRSRGAEIKSFAAAAGAKPAIKAGAKPPSQSHPEQYDGCFSWRSRGFCSRQEQGQRCPYTHLESERPPCYSEQQHGQCRRVTCRYRHQKQLQSLSPPSSGVAASVPSSSLVPNPSPPVPPSLPRPPSASRRRSPPSPKEPTSGLTTSNPFASLTPLAEADDIESKVDSDRGLFDSRPDSKRAHPPPSPSPNPVPSAEHVASPSSVLAKASVPTLLSNPSAAKHGGSQSELLANASVPILRANPSTPPSPTLLSSSSSSPSSSSPSSSSPSSSSSSSSSTSHEEHPIDASNASGAASTSPHPPSQSEPSSTSSLPDPATPSPESKTSDDAPVTGRGVESKEPSPLEAPSPPPPRPSSASSSVPSSVALVEAPDPSTSPVLLSSTKRLRTHAGSQPSASAPAAGALSSPLAHRKNYHGRQTSKHRHYR